MFASSELLIQRTPRYDAQAGDKNELPHSGSCCRFIEMISASNIDVDCALSITMSDFRCAIILVLPVICDSTIHNGVSPAFANVRLNNFELAKVNRIHCMPGNLSTLKR